MKMIGLLGGMSWESSIEYYRLLNESIKKELGGLHSARIVMYSVDFAPIEEWMREGKWSLILETLIYACRQLEKAGVDFILICTNTMHKLFEQIQDQLSIPLYHIADTTAVQILADGLQNVGLLGTRFTMEGDFYRKRVQEKFGLDVTIPDSEDRVKIDKIIFEELVVGKINPSSREIFVQIISKLKNRGAEGIILGCTEIPLLISSEDSPIPLYDTTALHVAYAVTKALENKQ